MRKTALALALCASSTAWAAPEPQTNVILITADDLGHEVFDLFTEGLPDITPNMNEYAASGVRFMKAHSNTSICMPSRSIMATGLYGINSGMMGFINLKDKSIPTVARTLSENGYKTGVLGKVSHSTPDMTYKWDYSQDYRQLGAGRNPELYYNFTKEFIESSKKSGQPFYLMVNSHDPHRPFHDPEKPIMNGKVARPSKLFSPDEVLVPEYLPDIPQVRLELSHYYNSVRRLDDTIGRILEAVEDTGVENNTFVMFMSDNGSAFPFAKANAYMFSSRTMFFAKWPAGNLKNGSIDDEHFISAVDLFPTILDVTGIKLDAEFNGKSILPLLRGKKQEGRDYVFTQIDYKIGGPATPIRSIISEDYVYIFNPWSRKGANFKTSGEASIVNAMMETGDPDIIERVRMLKEREVEEFYDLHGDPGSLNNLIDSPDMKQLVSEYREELLNWMAEHDDPALPMLEARHSPARMQEILAKGYPGKRSLMPDEQIALQQEKKRKRQQRKLAQQKKQEEEAAM